MEENKKDELLETINEQSKKDLEGAKLYEWGNNKEDVDVINQLKSKLDATSTNLKSQCDKIVQANSKNSILLELFKESKKTATDEKISSLLDEYITNLTKTIEENKKQFETFINSAKVIDDALIYFQYNVKEDGKAYFEDYAIKFATLLMKL